MLHTKEFIQIGQIRKSYGYQGLIRVSIDEIYEEDLFEQDFVFIGIDGYKVPFEIEAVSEAKGLNLKLHGLDTPEDISRYHNLPLYLLKEDIKHAKRLLEENQTLSGLGGMHLYDINQGFIGIIDRIEEYPQQLMAIIVQNDQEILIPLHPSLIDSIDTKNQKLMMNLPEGLL